MFVSGESSYQFFGGEAVLWNLLFIKKKKLPQKPERKTHWSCTFLMQIIIIIFFHNNCWPNAIINLMQRIPFQSVR